MKYKHWMGFGLLCLMAWIIGVTAICLSVNSFQYGSSDLTILVFYGVSGLANLGFASYWLGETLLEYEREYMVER